MRGEMTMKRLILVCVMILCMMPFAATADGSPMGKWEESNAFVRQEAADAYPDWTVSAASVYGSGTWQDEMALNVDVLLDRVENNTLYFLELHVLANPLWEGEPIEWHENHLAPVPLDTVSVDEMSEAFPQLKYPDETGIPWLASPSGCAAFMLRDGEHWEELGTMSHELVGIAVDAEGRKGLRIASWDGSSFGTVIASPMTDTDFDLDTYQSGDGFLIVDLYNDENEPYAYISREGDGTWRWSGVNTGFTVYKFYDRYVLEDTFPLNYSNAMRHYGRLTFPMNLEELDFSCMAFFESNLVAYLNSDAWACVRENDTPMYTMPDGEMNALCYARLAGTIVAEENGWVCLQIGSEERGICGWFRREHLSFGAAIENIHCGFPEYEAEIDEAYTWKKDLAAFVNRVLDSPYGAIDVDNDFGSVWIIGRAPDGRWLMEIDEDVVAFTRAGVEIITSPAADFINPFDEEKMWMLQTDSGDGAYAFDSFMIIERQGKYGISDPDGHLLLPVEYYIPTDQFDPDRQPVCVLVYSPVDGDFNIKDLDWELDRGTVKAGFFHSGSGYFSQCKWKSVFASDEYVSVRDENDRYSLLNAETGEVVLGGNQYAWINPYESENWVYVWLWPDEMDEEPGPEWDIAYISLVDGTILNEPDGYHFSEEYEPIVNGSVIVYDETGKEYNMRIEDILQKDIEQVRQDAERAAPLFAF